MVKQGKENYFFQIHNLGAKQCLGGLAAAKLRFGGAARCKKRKKGEARGRETISETTLAAP